MRILLIACALVTIQGRCFAQHEDHHEQVHKWEIGIANGIVYFLNEQEWSYGLHTHIVRAIGETHFALGMGYERIFDEHGHNTLSGVISYMPLDGLAVTAAPGIAFSSTGLVEFATHLEMTYEFEIKNYHVGPLIEWAIEPDEMHFTLGLHVGFGL